ncbi:UDP-N-acetylglucosamine transferase subunit ALG14 homolog isoform X2 [Loxodonta africana]|uniref:UDP-N-acetylglucosamine transferase subunit ALG14 homolog isoform X2 n=1 Tax=Loxodonta africana TaxID=9785 RepID=UPI0030D1B47D
MGAAAVKKVKSLSLVLERQITVDQACRHTAGILRLLGKLSNAYRPRNYIFADMDEMSAHKIRAFEVDRAERYSSTMLSMRKLGSKSARPKN